MHIKPNNLKEIYMRVWVDVDPKSKYLFFGLIGIAFGAVFINYAAAWYVNYDENVELGS